MKTKRKINLHASKVWAFIYPIYANNIVFGGDYEQFAQVVSHDFYLTPDQWESVLDEWVLIHGAVLTY
jgi:hypothetical protein